MNINDTAITVGHAVEYLQYFQRIITDMVNAGQSEEVIQEALAKHISFMTVTAANVAEQNYDTVSYPVHLRRLRALECAGATMRGIRKATSVSEPIRL